MYRELLRDQERVLGPDDFETLATRSNVADWTGRCGDTAGALRMLQELLPDKERILSADHPETLTTRSNISGYTGECGDWPAALGLFRELLPTSNGSSGPRTPKPLEPAALSPTARASWRTTAGS
jgi:Tetratricopeptide repeat